MLWLIILVNCLLTSCSIRRYASIVIFNDFCYHSMLMLFTFSVSDQTNQIINLWKKRHETTECKVNSREKWKVGKDFFGCLCVFLIAECSALLRVRRLRVPVKWSVPAQEVLWKSWIFSNISFHFRKKNEWNHSHLRVVGRSSTARSGLVTCPPIDFGLQCRTFRMLTFKSAIPFYISG